MRNTTTLISDLQEGDRFTIGKSTLIYVLSEKSRSGRVKYCRKDCDFVHYTEDREISHKLT